jgi:putative transposase
VRRAAKESGISKSSVHRYLQLFSIKPHLSESFKLSTDAFFIEKLRDVVGLYQRHGTTTLFAALDVLNGTVLTECKPRHRHQQFLAFLCKIEASVPHNQDIHLIVDNYSTHKHARVKAWMARRPRWHLHFIPTYSSWLNQVERFFALITEKTIRRGSFFGVKDLVGKVDHFVTQYNKDCTPFVWTATADSILETLERLSSRINGTGHQQLYRRLDVDRRVRRFQSLSSG